MSQQDSKKRKYADISKADNKEDEELLFGEASASGAVRDIPHDYDEAQEDNELEHPDVQASEEEESGEDIMENMEQDYERRPELDAYEGEGIDDEEQNELNMAQRMEVDREMARDQRMQRHNRVPGAFLMDDDMEQSDEMAHQLRNERNGANRGAFGRDDGEDYQENIDFEDVKGKLSLWVQRPEVIKWIRKIFMNFLRVFKDEHGAFVYEHRVNDMCTNNKQSLEVTFNHLSQRNPTLAIWLAEEPSLILPILNEVATEITLELFPEYAQIHSQVFVRVKDLPVEDKLRDLRQIHCNALIKIRGVVTKRTGIFPEQFKIFYRCQCGDVKGPYYHNSENEARVNLGTCILCQSNGPYVVDEQETLYRNYQKMTIQESPGSVPPGRVPRQKEVYLLNDLVDCARPGDEVEITGIYINRFDYFANLKHGFPVFQTIIEANLVKRFGDEEVFDLTDEDKQAIRDLSRKQNIGKKIINSIAPSIYGHEFIKKALALSLFGGEAKDIGGKHRIRGDINVLLLGDPGTAKSQFLKYVEQVFDRCVYTTGKGASAVGLTAGVHKDPVTREWTLEGGALVLADRGICLIDEFDKMNDQDRTSIHEAMEQQSISISKAGIVTSLQARCSVIAAANPLKGNYNSSLNFIDNVDLTDPILSRFDILSVIKDEVEEEADDALATFVLNSHMKSHPEIMKETRANENVPLEAFTEEQLQAKQRADEWLGQNLLQEKYAMVQEDFVPQDLLKKYIAYARKYIHPKLNEIDKEKVTQFYADIRRESNMVGGIPIAVRHIESVLRMAESNAKMHLREFVRSDDIDLAIEMLLESFLQSQKVSVARQLTKKFEQYRTRKTDPNQLLLHSLKKLASTKAIMKKYMQGLEEEEKVEVLIPVEAFEQEVRDFNQHSLQDFLQSSHFRKEFVLEDRHIRTLIKL